MPSVLPITSASERADIERTYIDELFKHAESAKSLKARFVSRGSWIAALWVLLFCNWF